MKNIRVLLAGVLGCVGGGMIMLGALRLFQSTPEADVRICTLEAQLAERDRTIAELRNRLTAPDATVRTAEQSSSMHPVEPIHPRPQGADTAAAQRRLEAVFQRLERRFTHLEIKMKQSRLIPGTRQEYEAELKRGNETLAVVRERLKSEYEEVHRLAVALNVPEAVTKLSPHEAVNDPRYQIYKAYFAAKIAASYTQSLVFASEQAIAQFDIQRPDNQ